VPQTKFDKPKDDRHKNWWILYKIARKTPTEKYSLLNCQNIHHHYDFQKCININLVIGLVSFVSK